MKRKVIYWGLAFLLCIGVVYSCSKGSSSSTTTPPPTGGANTVSIQNFAFAPSSITVKAGSTVTWTNLDSAPHTVTDIGGTFDSGSVSTNGTFSQKFTTAGTFTYHCTIHSMMANATVIVTK